MDVRRLARCAVFVVVLTAASVAGCRGAREEIEDMDWSWRRFRPDPAPSYSGPSFARLWEDGFGFNNPNGPKIRSGEKKPGEKLSKNNPYREREEQERKEEERERRAARSDGLRVEEPEFDFR